MPLKYTVIISVSTSTSRMAHIGKSNIECNVYRCIKRNATFPLTHRFLDVFQVPVQHFLTYTFLRQNHISNMFTLRGSNDRACHTMNLLLIIHERALAPFLWIAEDLRTAAPIESTWMLVPCLGNIRKLAPNSSRREGLQVGLCKCLIYK